MEKDSFPEPFNNMSTRADVTNFLAHNGVNLSNFFTIYQTQLGSYNPQYNEYLKRCKAATRGAAKSAVCADMVDTLLRWAGPVISSTFTLSFKYQEHCRAWMAENALDVDYDSYIGENSFCSNSKLIDKYRENVISFRRDLEATFGDILEEAPILTGEVKSELKVHDADINVLMAMLVDMKAKDTARLGGRARGGGARKPPSEEHLEAVKQSFDGASLTPFDCEVRGVRRKALGNAKTVSNLGVVSDLPNMGMNLVSSALLYFKQNNEEEYEVYRKKMESILKSDKDYYYFQMIMAEIDSASGGESAPKSSETKQFKSQAANIDPLWFQAYFTWVILDLDIEDFPRFQKIIYYCCKKTTGNNTIRRKLENHTNVPGITKLISKISRSTHIYLPPWVFNLHRMQDLGASIGGMDMSRPTSLTTFPGVSWRNYMSLKPSINSMLVFVTAYFQMEIMNLEHDTAEERLKTIFQSERILQQFIMGRSGALSCTNMLTGNSLNVTFIK